MISIIIVNYHVKQELFLCIKSIIESKTKTNIEIIVVDNDEVKTIEKELREQYPFVKYISNENKGFGQANNIGAKNANGNYLFFLNPDTKIYPQCINLLIDYLEKNNEIGIVAPYLYDQNEIAYPQGSETLNPINAIFTFSIINRLSPNNFIARKFWMENSWGKINAKVVDSIPGTAFIIRKELFEQLDGFDEHFFLYFEENDLCLRTKKLGWKIIMLPKAKVYHALGSSTKKSNMNIKEIFKQSRYFYFKKHYGTISALITESILRTGKTSLVILCILFAGLFLRIYKINQFMPLIGDQGWFYLSARDLLLQRSIPLVGITSSHVWLHQGALWTYFLAFALIVGRFNPLSGAYLSIFFDIISIYFLYKLGSIMFSHRVGLISALLYAFSPAVILNSRMPYHTSLIPFFSIIFIYFTFMWVKKGIRYFPFIIFILAVLYNLELATFCFAYLIIMLLIFGFLRREKWIKGFWEKKNIIYTIIAFTLPMLPMIIYDSTHRYVQTLGFLAWNIYKFISIFGLANNHAIGLMNWGSMFIYAATRYQLLIFAANSYVSTVLLVIILTFVVYKMIFMRNYILNGFIITILTAFFSTSALIFSRTESGAYLPMIYPSAVLLTAYFFVNIMVIRRRNFTYFIILILCLFQVSNSILLVDSNYSPGMANYFDYQDMVNATKSIIIQTAGKAYNIRGEGSGSQFASFTMNYEYLLWWEGSAPSKSKENIQFIIREDASGTHFIKEYE